MKLADTIDFEEAGSHLLNLQHSFCLESAQKTAVWSSKTQAILCLPVKAFTSILGAGKGVGCAEVS